MERLTGSLSEGTTKQGTGQEMCRLLSLDLGLHLSVDIVLSSSCF